MMFSVERAVQYNDVFRGTSRWYGVQRNDYLELLLKYAEFGYVRLS